MFTVHLIKEMTKCKIEDDGQGGKGMKRGGSGDGEKGDRENKQNIEGLGVSVEGKEKVGSEGSKGVMSGHKKATEDFGSSSGRATSKQSPRVLTPQYPPVSSGVLGRPRVTSGVLVPVSEDRESQPWPASASPSPSAV